MNALFPVLAFPNQATTAIRERKEAFSKRILRSKTAKNIKWLAGGGLVVGAFFTANVPMAIGGALVWASDP